MRLLQWKAEFNTGIRDVDRRHRILIAQINRLQNALDRGECRSNGTFFQDLHATLAAHFAREEASVVANSPALLRHKQDHERLLEEIREMAESFENAEEIDSVEVSSRLERWCARHFISHDAGGPASAR